MKKELREKIWRKYGGKCAYCGEDIDYEKMQVDHIHPKFLGGKNNIDNLHPSCRPCNFYKSTFTIEEFKKQLGCLVSRLKKIFIFRLAIRYNIISIGIFSGKLYYEKINEENLSLEEKILRKNIRHVHAYNPNAPINSSLNPAGWLLTYEDCLNAVTEALKTNEQNNSKQEK